MTERTTQSIVIEAPADRIMAVIADFAEYPSWVSAAKSVEVRSSLPNGRASRVRFVLDAGVIKDEYELAYTWSPDGLVVSWKLVDGGIQKAQSGSYTLEPLPDNRTRVTYELEVDLSIPVIGLLKRRAEKVITDTALKELKKRVER
ncbi:SRPBCC family protein [Hoyosella rhizosphaerae]|uniref:Cyclase n=1 Tax=Hoyosella rhizosphaerae TaxID=1755582 RepID=A0A916XGA0_9ACTN|nr:SRPBCC family protein [Hoyosella rhizosphaerae]MBN4927942.1 SRPBCC family protein [Hoyosella rhizosphaerae]GGC71177.1 cyclase [Hoyosella rhizosphaerae]